MEASWRFPSLLFKATIIIMLKQRYHRVYRIASGKQELKTEDLKYLYIKELYNLLLYLYPSLFLYFMLCHSLEFMCGNTDEIKLNP